MNRMMAVVLIGIGLAPVAAMAQPEPGIFAVQHVEVAVGYTAIRANAPPQGGCGCFWMNGGSAQLSAGDRQGFGAVFDFGMTSATNIGSDSGHNLTLATYVAGPRYTVHNRSRATPYAQALFGAAHSATNSIIDNGSLAFAFSASGGVDIRLKHRISWRAAQAEYLLTHVPNADNNRQNQLRLTSGLVFAFR